MYAMIPIPGRGRALEAARDLANDVRKIAEEMILLSPEQVEEYAMKKTQIRDMCEITFFDVEENKKFRVGDYVTPAAEFRMLEREKSISAAYERVSSSLLH